uniref:SLV.26 n=1 Tax=Streptomyces lavendulae TaxID=1914 RepID=Q6RGP4_STRLA|nr:SLV.26 [Streptomyces lavendulae]
MTPRPWSAKAMRALIVAAGICAAVVASIGFVGSYTALRDLAMRRGFGDFSYVFPVGIDAGIVAMYALDLILVWRRMPKPVLRLLAHLLTLATIVFNAYSGQPPLEDPLSAAMHAVMPVLFVAVVEAVRHLIIRTNRLSMKVASDRVPLHRWVLAPWPTWCLYRRMRLWEITSYAQMVAMEKDRTVYRAWLQHKHGRGWKKKAGATAMLPFTMAPYGLTVDQALVLPEEQKAAEAERAAAERERAAAAEAREEQRALEAEERAAAAQVRRMEIAAGVTTAEHRITAETTAAQAESRAAEAAAHAEAQAAEATAAAAAETAAHTARLAAEATRRQAERDAKAAERSAEREEQAERSAEEAEAKAREEAARRSIAEDRKRTADATAEAEAKERSAAADKLFTAEANRIAKEHDRAAAKAEEETAESERRAAEHRAATERAELAAQEAEDLARLGARERAERKVARMILAAWNALPAEERPDQMDKVVSLDEVGAALNVKQTVAGERRQAAMDLIKAGYAG